MSRLRVNFRRGLLMFVIVAICVAIVSWPDIRRTMTDRACTPLIERLHRLQLSRFVNERLCQPATADDRIRIQRLNAEIRRVKNEIVALGGSLPAQGSRSVTRSDTKLGLALGI